LKSTGAVGAGMPPAGPSGGSGQAFGPEGALYAWIGIHARLEGGQGVQAGQVDAGTAGPAQGHIEVGVGEAAEAGQPVTAHQDPVGTLEQAANAGTGGTAQRLVLHRIGDEGGG